MTYEITDMIMDDRFELEHPDLVREELTAEQKAVFDKIFEDWLLENQNAIETD